MNHARLQRSVGLDVAKREGLRVRSSLEGNAGGFPNRARPSGPVNSSCLPSTHRAPCQNPLRNSWKPTTTLPSSETPSARLDCPETVLPRSTMPVDSSHRKALAMLQPFHARPTMTFPSVLVPIAVLNKLSHGAALEAIEPSNRHSVVRCQIPAW
jgi:hypothetical protein